MNAKNHVVENLPTAPPLLRKSKAGPPHKRPRVFGNDVFIMHGADETAKTTVTRFVDKLGVKPTLFHDKFHNGRFDLEKFEAVAKETGFAIVLLTADDVCTEKGKPAKEWNPRASQKVLLALGYFFAELGAERVFILYQEGVELPSDYGELTYIPMGNAENWQTKLTRRMQQAGLPINLDKARENQNTA